MRTLIIILFVVGTLLIIGGRVYRNAQYYKARRNPEAWQRSRPLTKKVILVGSAIDIVALILLIIHL